jgi:hypothetical protein
MNPPSGFVAGPMLKALLPLTKAKYVRGRQCGKRSNRGATL